MWLPSPPPAKGAKIKKRGTTTDMPIVLVVPVQVAPPESVASGVGVSDGDTVVPSSRSTHR
jgi:hypothetical protein